MFQFRLIYKILFASGYPPVTFMSALLDNLPEVGSAFLVFLGEIVLQ